MSYLAASGRGIGPARNKKSFFRENTVVRYNPFVPKAPVRPEMFIGRLDEISQLETALYHTKLGHPSHFMIVGDRGLGKTSLLNYIKYVAKGNRPIGNIQTNFLVVDISIDPSTTQISLIKKIEINLKQELGEVAKALGKTLDFVQRLELGGFKLNPQKENDDIDLIIDEFSYFLSGVVERITDTTKKASLIHIKHDGILILIDEADKCSPQLEIGSFFKRLTENLQKRDCYKICIGLAGLPKLRSILLSSHPSSPRIFDEISLEILDDKEINEILESSIKQAEKQNGERYYLTDDARKALIKLSEGYPHFIQQFGRSIFSLNKDNIIDIQDFINGVLGKHGAAEVLASRYYDSFLNKNTISNNLKIILMNLAKNNPAWVSKSQLLEEYTEQEEKFTSIIKQGLELDLLITDKNNSKYKIKYLVFAIWIKHSFFT